MVHGDQPPASLILQCLALPANVTDGCHSVMHATRGSPTIPDPPNTRQGRHHTSRPCEIAMLADQP